MGGLGIALIPVARDVGAGSFISGERPWYYQLLIGGGFGFLTAKAGWGIVELPYLAATKRFFVSIFKPLQLGIGEILFISFCAGVGEELLFRGAVQPFLGIWTTSILFVLIHGYLNPFNPPMMIYGIYMTVVIAVIGYFTEFYGILTAMAAHFTIDTYLLYELSVADIGGEDPNDPGSGESPTR